MKQFSGFHQVLTLSKKHWVELSHLLPRCRGEHSERKPEIELFSFSSIWLNDFWYSWEPQAASPEERFWRLSFEKSIFCFDSRILSKKLVRLLARSFRQFFQNWIPCEQKIRLRKKLFDGKLRLYSSFPDVERWLNVTFGKKKFRGACQRFLLSVQRNFLEKTTLWKLSYRWLNLEFERKPCGTIFKLLLGVQWNSVKSCFL